MYESGLTRGRVAEADPPAERRPSRRVQPSRTTAADEQPIRLEPTPRKQTQQPGTLPAGKALGAGLVALLLAMLLNADALVRDAERKPFGTGRDVSLAVWEPVQTVANAVGITSIRSVADEALGRDFGQGDFDLELVPTTTVAAAGPGSDPTTPTTQSADPAAPTPEVSRDDATPAATTPTTVATTTTTEAPKIATVEDPLTVWIGGDSMAQVFGQRLELMATATNVITPELDYKISSGLTRPDFFNWPAKFADVITNDDPDVMVVIFGANDAQGMELDTGVFQPFADEWVAEYSGRVGFVMDQLTADPDRLVIWVGQPVMRSGDFDAKMDRLNEIYLSEAAGRDRVIFYDSRPLFSNSSGDYEAHLPDLDGDVVNMRQQDGAHLSLAGGDLLADAVLTVLGEHVELADDTSTPAGGE